MEQEETKSPNLWAVFGKVCFGGIVVINAYCVWHAAHGRPIVIQQLISVQQSEADLKAEADQWKNEPKRKS